LACLREGANTFERIRLTPPRNAFFDGALAYLTYDPYRHALLISTCSYGLIVYSIRGKTAEFFNAGNTPGLHNNLHLPFVAARDTFLLPTDGGGLLLFDYRNKTCLNATPPAGEWSLPDVQLNSISRVFRDSRGNYWFGSSNSNGVKLYAPARNKFRSHFRRDGAAHMLSNNLVMDFYQDPQENLWICTDGGGLNRYDRRTGTYTHYFTGAGGPPTNKTLSLAGDRAGNLWLASWDGGISKLTADGKVVYNYLEHCSPAEKERYNWPLQVFNDSEDHLWIAFIKGGLGYYDKQTNRIHAYGSSGGEKGGFLSDYVTYLYEDSRKNIWVCTYNGLAYFNLRETDFSGGRPNIRFHYLLPGKKPGGIASSEIASITEDKDGMYWIGHLNHGLDRYDLARNTFRNYSVKNGLPANAIKGLLCDRYNDLWVFTNKGTARLRPADGSVARFDPNDGLLSQSVVGGPYQNAAGEIFVGSIHGFNQFDPARLHGRLAHSRPRLTGLKIYGEPVRAGRPVNGRVVLPRHLSDLRAIELSYREDFIALQYLAIEYGVPEKISYRYMLEGYDLNWVDAGNRREAAYRNLSPGTYTFKVKASDPEGGWPEAATELTITVLPPWWNTWWFKLPLALAAGGLVVGFYFWRINTLKAQRRQLERRVAESTAELRETNGMLSLQNGTVLRQQAEILAQNTVLRGQKAELERIARELDEAAQARTKFFMHISHEFRTPLTLITGPVEALLGQTDDENTRFQLQLVHRNAKRLLRLINQLLDLRRLETGSVQLQPARGDVTAFARNIFHSFGYLARRHKIHYEFTAPPEPWVAWFDQDVLEKILYNLLSNAFKYTPDGQSIAVSVAREEPPPTAAGETPGAAKAGLTIRVADTGTGMEAADLEKIFEPFYRVENPGGDRRTGTGIGLSLARELALLHHGTIGVESRPGEGSAFTVRLLLGREGTEAAAAGAKPAAAEWDSYPRNVQGVNAFEALTHRGVHEMDPAKPTLLVADDNTDITSYLAYSLQKDYNLICAPNGEEARQKAFEFRPDLIVSDIMMPGMDGLELSRKIKADARTCHIPVILLTAKTETASRVEGLRTGADDYITKPFDANLLKLKIGNLIDGRRKCIAQYQAEAGGSALLLPGPTDEQFLLKVNQIVEKHLGNAGFNAGDLGREIGMSRAHLYRKLQSLTRQSVNEFIRTVRLKKAAKVLMTARPGIADLAYSLGFNSPQYFTRCFKEQFGVSPTEFMDQH
ncbi:MAG: response regulator, partial [Cytophagales bacterium]|nr:response regulator [Cytophagales bacterium]